MERTALDDLGLAALALLRTAGWAYGLLVAAVGTRRLRARSFSEAVLDAVAAERYDAIVIQAGRETPCNGAKAQIDAVLERAAPTVVLVRPG